MRSWIVCLIAVWLTCCPTLARCGTPLTPEQWEQELISQIQPGLYYPGSDVLVFARGLIAAAETAIKEAGREGGEKAAAEAARPLLGRIAGLEAVVLTERRLRREAERDRFGRALAAAGIGLGVGLVAGGLLVAALSR